MIDQKYLHQKYILGTYANRSLEINHGEGMYLHGEDGKAYLDFMTNYGVNIFGHAHPQITEALTAQLKNLTTLHGSFINRQRSVVAEKLVSASGGGLSQVYFSNSGAEAVEAAIKFAVLATGKKRFIACEHGYHGKTLGALSATAGEKYKAPFRPLLWEFTSIHYDDTTALEKSIDDHTAAFIVEPIQGEGGIIPPDENYLNRVRDICTRHGVLLIIDEIQTGAGRTGGFLASHKNMINYDIVCLGKGLAGGIPVGATLVSKAVAGKIPRGSHTSTFGGNPLTCAGILATLELLDSGRLKYIENMGKYFQEKLSSALPDKYPVRGNGLMVGVDIGSNRNQILKNMQQLGVLAIPAGETVVRFLPPYIIEKKHIDDVINALVKALEVV